MGNADGAMEIRSFPVLPVYVTLGLCQCVSKHTFRSKTGRFTNFEVQSNKFDRFSNPFVVDMEKPAVKIQIEQLDLQCSDTVKAKYDSVGAAQFPCFIAKMMPQLRLHAAQMLSMFLSILLGEQLFSAMTTNKASHRSCFTDPNLCAILRISTAQSLTPNHW